MFTASVKERCCVNGNTLRFWRSIWKAMNPGQRIPHQLQGVQMVSGMKLPVAAVKQLVSQRPFNLQQQKTISLSPFIFLFKQLCRDLLSQKGIWFVDDWQADRSRLPRSIAANYEISLGSLLDVSTRTFGNGEATPGPSPSCGGNEKSNTQS